MVKHHSVVLTVAILAITHVSLVATCRGQQTVGELRIEGLGIEQLVLTGPGDQTRTFEPPGPTITLPPGVYVVRSVQLEGGHDSRSYMIPETLRVTVDPNASVTLKVGAPLRHVVKIGRRGSVMALNYELIGQGGERYVINRDQESAKPSFDVYRGDKKIASGDFEFG